MTILLDGYPDFEIELVNYESNQMYPPGYRKESPMKKLSMSHVNAICHAEFFVQGSLGKVPEALMRSQLEDDLLRLAELKLHIIEGLTKTSDLFGEKKES